MRNLTKIKKYNNLIDLVKDQVQKQPKDKIFLSNLKNEKQKY